jgi:hypothetical protein
MPPIYAVIYPAENTAEPHPSASHLISALIDEWSANRELGLSECNPCMEGKVLHRPSIDTPRENWLQARLQTFRKNSMRLGSSRHRFFRRPPPPGSQAAGAFGFIARSVSAQIHRSAHPFFYVATTARNPFQMRRFVDHANISDIPTYLRLCGRPHKRKYHACPRGWRPP